MAKIQYGRHFKAQLKNGRFWKCLPTVHLYYINPPSEQSPLTLLKIYCWGAGAACIWPLEDGSAPKKFWELEAERLFWELEAVEKSAVGAGAVRNICLASSGSLLMNHENIQYWTFKNFFIDVFKIKCIKKIPHNFSSSSLCRCLWLLKFV